MEYRVHYLDTDDTCDRLKLTESKTHHSERDVKSSFALRKMALHLAKNATRTGDSCDMDYSRSGAAIVSRCVDMYPADVYHIRSSVIRAMYWFQSASGAIAARQLKHKALSTHRSRHPSV